ncbi:MAG: IclR family transcriptional regulator [Gammaproteobacteria bacterium]|nr:IclR family transcriptional regulator [Gammaproteobacteria bacterium]
MPEKSAIQVIDRMSSLLDAIARYPESVSLKVLAAETGLHSSTAFRILDAMVTNGFVERDAAGKYQLGRKLLRLGSRVRAQSDVRQIALPVMARLRDELEESINLTIREGDEVVYIEKATPNRMMHVQQLIGSRAPLHVTAVGKLMLAMSGEAECEGYAVRTNLPAYTRNTINSLPRLLKEAKKIRAQGYAFDNEEAEIGVGCIGALIYDGSDNIVAGLSVSAPIDRRRSEWVNNIVQGAREISEQLGYRGN